MFDLLRRYLEYRGYNVKYIQNFTDVDDKIIKAANEELFHQKNCRKRYIREYFTDAHMLGICDADVHPKVSEHIGEIIEIIQTLEEKATRITWTATSTSACPHSRSTANCPGSHLMTLWQAKSRSQNDEKKARLILRFEKIQEGEPYWDSPWGKGRPGWPIECSAMSPKIFRRKH